jgi:recombination protein RecT
MSTVATRDDTPTTTIANYQGDFAQVLPATFKPETFVRLAQGALRQNPKLMRAAQANPASLLVALLEAARLGHEPATDDYYLRPLGGKDGPSVQGIEGYKGIVKRMFNSGAVDSVVAEAVYDHDRFDWEPGKMRVPEHQADWFGDRGLCIGSYAYAVFKGGGVSKVVVVGRNRIKRAKDASDGVNSNFSPWRNDYEKMVIKTALRDLEPYVPKSAEMQHHEADARAALLQVVQDHPELEAATRTYEDPPADERLPHRVTAAEIMATADTSEPVVGETVDLETGEVLDGPNSTAELPITEEPEGWSKK